MNDQPLPLPASFDLSGRVAVITGGGGLLGGEHASALLETGAAVVLLDIRPDALDARVAELRSGAPGRVSAAIADVVDPDAVERALDSTLSEYGRVDILINNAARDPKVDSEDSAALSRLENLHGDDLDADIAVGLAGAVHCSRWFGGWMADHGGGVILNVASDLAVIAPDQRLYARQGTPEDQQPAKPVSYSVVKTGVVGLTRYLATYWAAQGVRANALSPGGILADQDKEFVSRLVDRIPLGRMARRNEYRGAVQFLCSDASAYLNGHNLVMDGGRSVW